MTSSTIAGLLTCALCASGAACADPKPSVYPAQPSYVEDSTAAPNDLLEIRVAKQEPLTGEFEIDGDGMISFPHIGAVASSGKTPLQIGTEIHDRLADGYLRDPQVTVRIKERRSKRISVFGEVRRGTIIPFNDGMTILEAISVAGGFTPRAWENAVKVTRKTQTGAQEFTVPVNRIATGKAAPFFMRPGDSVYVPKSPM
jgi:protein involved in polysaccharide export with SLBB domain